MRYLNKTLVAMSLALGGVAAVSLALPTSALADKSSKRVKNKTVQAMGEYDMMEFEAAKSLLMEAIAIGERNDVKGPELANAYLNLGIVYFSGLGEEEKATEAFENALGVDGEVKLSVSYSTPEMSELLEAARSELAPAGGGECNITGLSHSLVDEAAMGSAPEMRAHLGADVDAASVLVFYRGEGQLEFSKAALKKSGDCEYVGNIPTRAVQGDFVHYYIAAVDSDGKELEHKGTSGSPNIIEVAAASGGSLSGDSDNPLASGKKDSLLTPSSGPVVFLSIAAGTGGGFIQGPTEKTESEVGCCIGPALFHLMPEIGYYLNDQLSLSAAFRMGFPVGANVDGHATLAPAGLLRVRYALEDSGEGVQVSGSIGGGIIRNTVQIQDAEEADMDTDTTAMGPFLLGAGIGYGVSVGGPIRLVAEISALAAISAGIEDFGSVKPKTGAQLDANLALLFAF